MSDDGNWNLPTPAFKAGDAMLQLQRALRDLKLAERGNAYELRGKRVAELTLEGTDTLAAKLARKLAFVPEWDRIAIKTAAEQRRFIDEVKKRLARWEQDE
jgi:hypothetical protein